MMPDCVAAKEWIRMFIDGRLDGSEARSLKLHLLSCTECREEALREDPLILFSLLSLREKESGFWRGYWERIAGEIRFKKIWPIRIPLFQPSAVPAAIAAVIVITVLSIVALLNVGNMGEAPQKISAQIDHGIITTAGTTRGVPVVDTTIQPTAEVMTLTVGDTDVVMIFDENMDI